MIAKGHKKHQNVNEIMFLIIGFAPNMIRPFGFSVTYDGAVNTYQH